MTNISNEDDLRKYYAHMLIHCGAYHKVRIKGTSIIFPKQYTNDPLHAWGYNAVIDKKLIEESWWLLNQDIEEGQTAIPSVSTQPHLTVAYSPYPMIYPMISLHGPSNNKEVNAILKIYDTRNNDPGEWVQIPLMTPS
jgi:hypothetical protein